MYNRYLDQSTASELSWSAPSPPESAPEDPQPSPAHQNATHKPSELLGEVTSGLSDFLGGFLKNFSLSNLDSGDILLVLIILFLFLEGDNLELVITLGLMLLLGLGDD